MNIISVIPARLAASRFPNKPLAQIENIPMVGHCFYMSRLINGLKKLMLQHVMPKYLII